jgi:tetratricopeptide (TPR) repeat protein
VARAAVRAKQAQRAQAQAAAKPSRKQRKHASGGNPNQQLFFSRLRRRQKWVFLALAIVFAVSFVFIGVGSGSGGGLDQLYSGIFGGNGNAVGKAEAEIKANPTNPGPGYKALADAYVTKNDLPNAIGALQTYLNMKKTDSSVWSQLGGYQKQQGDTAAGQYQQVLQSTAIQAPGSVFTPGGALATQLGTNPIDQYYSQKNQAISTPLYQQAITAYNASLTDFQNAAKYATKGDRPNAWLAVYSAAQLAGNTKAALKSLKQYVALSPNSPNLKQIEKQCKQLGGSCVPAKK